METGAIAAAGIRQMIMKNYGTGGGISMITKKKKAIILMVLKVGSGPGGLIPA